jgi:hypothetical protein
VAQQKRRTLLAWDVTSALTGNTLGGTMDRIASLWIYVPNSAAHGMYWYNILKWTTTFSATRVN